MAAICTVESELEPGLSITVKPGTAVVFAHKGRPTDVWQEGSYTIDAASLPEASKRVKIQAFGPKSKLQLDAYIVDLSPQDVAWESGVTISKDRKNGVTHSAIAGRAGFQVVDPAAFVMSMLAESVELAKLTGDKMAQMFPTFLKGKSTKYSAQFAKQNVGSVAETIVKAWCEILVYQQVSALRPDPANFEASKDSIYKSSGAAIEGWLAKHGCKLVVYSVDTLQAVQRDPCQSCGSETAPTGYAIFRRNISLFYVRFDSSVEGNYCVPCACKVSFLTNCVMLIAGWWGIVGIILTPVYLVLNVANLVGVIIAKKVSSVALADSERVSEATPQA